MTHLDRLLARLPDGPATEGRLVYDLQLPTRMVTDLLVAAERAGTIQRIGSRKVTYALRMEAAA